MPQLNHSFLLDLLDTELDSIDDKKHPFVSVVKEAVALAQDAPAAAPDATDGQKVAGVVKALFPMASAFLPASSMFLAAMPLVLNLESALATLIGQGVDKAEDALGTAVAKALPVLADTTASQPLPTSIGPNPNLAGATVSAAAAADTTKT